MSHHTSRHYGGILWQQYRKSRWGRLALWLLACFMAVALLAPLLANQKPLYAVIDGQSFFPALCFRATIKIKTRTGTQTLNVNTADWKHMKLDAVVWAPVPYSAGKSEGSYTSPALPRNSQIQSNQTPSTTLPLRFRHWLGTGSIGDDVLAGLINGSRISLLVGFASMFIATVLGLLLGLLAGYYGDHELKLPLAKLLMLVPAILLGWFYAFQLRGNMLSESMKGSAGGLLLQLLISIGIFAAVLAVFMYLGKLLSRLPFLKRKIVLPADLLTMRFIETVTALPTILIAVALAAVSRPSLLNVILILGFTMWPGIARFVRAETLRIRQLEYVQAARAMGYSNFRIIFRHVLRNALAPVLVIITFGIANAILLESSLSFLSIGVPATVTTWGSLINDGKNNLSAWWIVTFPGICILLVVLCLNTIGETLRDAMDPRLKS